jgi:hypothetical protein
MSEHVSKQLELLRTAFPELEYLEADHWVRIEDRSVPAGWSAESVDVAFRIPADPGTPPYGFYVAPPITLANGRVPGNYTYPIPPETVPFAGEWGLFSWSPANWRPHHDPAKGDNMLDFARSLSDRLAEAS